MAINQQKTSRRVNSLPTTGLVPGQNYELYLGGDVYRNYVVSDSRRLVAQDGKEFIECDTVAQLRGLDSRQIWAIQNGYYKGVTLNGYYKANDTPRAIQYYLSDTVEEDDGGSVFEVGGIKLEHDFADTVNIRYFGAKEDVLFDSYPNFKKAIQYCNRVNLPIKVNGDFTFKGDGEDLFVYIDMDFTDSNILMDPNGNINFRIRSVSRPEDIFNSQNINEADKLSLLNSVQNAINSNDRTLTGVALDRLANKYCCLRTLTARRTPELVETNRLSTTQTWYKEENFFIDVHGNVEGSFYNNDLSLVGEDGEANYLIRGFDFKSKREFKGGNIVYAESNTGTGDQTYREIGFYFEGLCNLNIYNVNSDLWGIKNKIYGFIRILECYNVKIDDFSAIPANHTETTGSNSSYVLNITDSQNVFVNKYVCPDLLNLEQWGSTCGHRSYNVNYTNCVANRIDCHYRGFDWSIKSCKLGKDAIRYSGGGKWIIKDVDIYKSRYIMGGRPDYASEFIGDIYIEDVRLYTSFDNFNAVIDISVANDGLYNYNFHPNKPNEVIRAGCINLHIKNVTFSNEISLSNRTDIFASAIRIDLENIPQNIKIPNVYVDTINYINAKNPKEQYPLNSGFSLMWFSTYKAFMQIKQGNNNNNVTEASATVPPEFNEINNQILEAVNIDFSRDNSPNLIRFNSINSSDFNDSDNKPMAPMPVIRLYNCKGVVPVTEIYRAKIEAINCIVANALTHVYSGFVSWNKWIVSGGSIIINHFNYPIVSTTSLQGDSIINNVLIDCSNDTTDQRIASFFFRNNNYPSTTITPIVITLDLLHPSIRTNFLSPMLKSRLQAISNGLVGAGNKGFTVSYVEKVMINNREGYIDEITSLVNLPVLLNQVRFFFIKLLYSSSTVKEDLTWNGTRWINQHGAVAGTRKSGTTVQRPLLTDVPIGYVYIDNTLNNKPIYSTGTTWVDSTGTVV